MTAFDPLAPALDGVRIMRQTWADIAFVHWAVDPDLVAPMMPAGVRPDVLGDRTFVGLIPFRMRGAGFGRGPAVPWLGSFDETNVRLYSVDDQGRHGVVFASLESSRLVVSALARLVFGTPYTWARTSVREEDDRLVYETWRRWPGPRGAGGRLVVRPRGPVLAEPDDVAQFVTARFGLPTRRAGRPWWVPTHHAPGPRRRADLAELDDTLVEAAGLPGLAGTEPASVLWSAGTFTTFGTPRALPRAGAAARA